MLLARNHTQLEVLLQLHEEKKHVFYEFDEHKFLVQFNDEVLVLLKNWNFHHYQGAINELVYGVYTHTTAQINLYVVKDFKYAKHMYDKLMEVRPYLGVKKDSNEEASLLKILIGHENLSLSRSQSKDGNG